MIQLLPPEEWHKLESIFESEWGGEVCLPHPDHAIIIADIEDDELLGFCVLETLVRPGLFYVSPRHRGKNGTVRKLLSYIVTRASQSGRSFVAFADQERYGKLLKSMGMKAVGMAYRKDHF